MEGAAAAELHAGSAKLDVLTDDVIDGPCGPDGFDQFLVKHLN